MTKDQLLEQIRQGLPLSSAQRLRLVMLLAWPSIMAQLSTIVMEYIDASMVGSLGAEASAAIGLVSTTIWLFSGLTHAASTGFSVQVAHLVGANMWAEARQVLRQAISACLVFSVTLGIVGVCISPWLPVWLGADEAICHDASIYFLFFSLALPLAQFNSLMGGMLRSTGNTKVPATLNILMCVLDVVFNYLLIMVCGLGVLGAVLGTLLAFLVCASAMTWCCVVRSRELALHQDSGTYRLSHMQMIRSLRISLPIGLERVVMCGAQITSTIIVAPLGTIAIAANAFGIIIEALCYMPGYGIADAATTLVGQSIGARRPELARQFAYIAVAIGMTVMSLLAVVMYVGCEGLMPLMTPDVAVQQLTAEVLRIEALAEPMFAASIVCYGVFVGTGDTRIPSAMNLTCIWAVRITLAMLLADTMGLRGVWIAMAVELGVRGTLFLVRLFSSRWQKVKGS